MKVAPEPTGRFESWKYCELTGAALRLTLQAPSLRKVSPPLTMESGANAGLYPDLLRVPARNEFRIEKADVGEQDQMGRSVPGRRRNVSARS